MPLVRCVQGLKHGVFFFPIALSGTTRANLKSQVGAQVRTIGVRFVQSDTQALGGQRNPLFDRQCCLGFVFRIAISVFLILLVASSACWAGDERTCLDCIGVCFVQGSRLFGNLFRNTG